MPKLSDSQIREVVERIFDVCEPEEVFVFGSQASGQSGPDSDLDLLVVTESEERNPREIQIDIIRNLHGFMFGIDVFVITPEEFERQKGNRFTFAGRAVEQGYSVSIRVQL